MNFLLNENISPQIKDYFLQHGHQCLDIYQTGLSGKTDEEVIEFAFVNKLIVITHDLISGKQFPSVITLRHKKLSLEIIQDSLQKVLSSYSDQLNSGSLLSIDEESIRLRKLPFQRE